ncbi:MAG: D-glycero-beta-D-manno-heptose 1-phosphate adenylyltransferase [Bacteroidales bacterium]
MERLSIIRSKIYSWEHLKRQIALWRFKDKSIVFSNGCFDVLHLGHVEYLAKARDLGDILIVGLNSDDSVHRIKGAHRPVNNEEARAITLAAMTFVDGVVMFDEDTPYELIKLVQPDILVKGKDYEGKEIVGSDIVKTRGGQVVTIELTKGYSTTHTIELAQKVHL